MIGVMRHGAGSSTVGGVWLGRRQMGMNVHVCLGLIHAAKGSWAGIVALLGDIKLRIQSLGPQIRLWRRAPGFLDSGSTGQTGASARTARARLLLCVVGIEGAGRGLGSSRQAQRGELVARQQRSFGRVVVVPGDVSRAAGVDLRDRRQLQLFGFTGVIF